MNFTAASQEVLKWEALHAEECNFSKLINFGGKVPTFRILVNSKSSS